MGRRFRPEDLQLPDGFDGFRAPPGLFAIGEVPVGFAADDGGDGELAPVIPLRPPEDAA